MREPLWSDKRILHALEKFSDENGQVIFSEAAWPVIHEMRDEYEARIDALEHEAEALAQGYREILAELQKKSDSKEGTIDMEKWYAFGRELKRRKEK